MLCSLTIIIYPENSWGVPSKRPSLRELNSCALFDAQVERQAGSEEKGAEAEKRQQRHTWAIPCEAKEGKETQEALACRVTIWAVLQIFHSDVTMFFFQ